MLQPKDAVERMRFVKRTEKIETHIEYFEDEELDAFRGITADQYTDEQIDIFRDILYTLQKEEVADWLISLEKEVSIYR